MSIRARAIMAESANSYSLTLIAYNYCNLDIFVLRLLTLINLRIRG